MTETQLIKDSFLPCRASENRGGAKFRCLCMRCPGMLYFQITMNSLALMSCGHNVQIIRTLVQGPLLKYFSAGPRLKHDVNRQGDAILKVNEVLTRETAHSKYPQNPQGIELPMALIIMIHTCYVMYVVIWLHVTAGKMWWKRIAMQKMCCTSDSDSRILTQHKAHMLIHYSWIMLLHLYPFHLRFYTDYGYL